MCGDLEVAHIVSVCKKNWCNSPLILEDNTMFLDEDVYCYLYLAVTGTGEKREHKTSLEHIGSQACLMLSLTCLTNILTKS